MEKEIWRKIPLEGYGETYEISSTGRLRNYKRGKIVQPDKSDKRGYLRYSLYYKNKKLRKGVHVLTALAFIPNTYKKPTVNHINGIKNDNRVSNLCWATSSEQILHAIETALKVQQTKQVIQYNKDGDVLGSYNSIKEAAKDTDSDGTKISAVCKGKRKSHNGFLWKYTNEKDMKNNVAPTNNPKGVIISNFSKYLITSIDPVQVYSLYKRRYIIPRKRGKYHVYMMIDDEGKRRSRSPNSIQLQVLCTKSEEKSLDGSS